MGSKKSEHQSSLLLSQEANAKIFALLEPKSQALSTALVGVVISKPPKHPDWKHLRNGIATLTKDYTRKAYFVQIYDIVDWERLREEELKKGTAYHASMPKFHQFEAGKGQTMGLKFASEDEARRFAQVARTIVMTGQYKTDGCPLPPEAKDGNEQPPEQQQEKNDSGETKSGKQRSSLTAPPPPPPPGNRSSLQPPPPPPPVNKEASLSSLSPPPTPVARDTSQSILPTDKQSLPQRPHSMPPPTSSAQSNNAEANSTDRNRPKSKRITKDMIGKPSDFQHVYHLGYGSSEPLDEKALQVAAGARPPAPSRPPPPPPPGKKSETSKTTSQPTTSTSAVNQVSGGERCISSSVNPASTKGQAHVDKSSDEKQDGSFSTLTPDVTTATDGDSFASDLIEEFLRRSNLASDAQDETQNAADEESVPSPKDQDITEDTENPLSNTDIELLNAENDMSRNKVPDEETQAVTPDTTSMGLQNTAVDSSSDIICNEEVAKDSLLESGTEPSTAENDTMPKDKAEDVEIQLDNSLTESGETSLKSHSEIISNEVVSEKLSDSTEQPEQSPEESSNEQQNDDVNCSTQNSADENQNNDDKECLLQEPTVDQENIELVVASSEGNHPNEPIQADVPKAPARHRKKQSKRLVTPPPTPPPTPVEVVSPSDSEENTLS